jgi:hypothetical protein
MGALSARWLGRTDGRPSGAGGGSRSSIGEEWEGTRPPGRCVATLVVYVCVGRIDHRPRTVRGRAYCIRVRGVGD